MLLFDELLMILLGLLGLLSFALWGEILRRKLVGLPVIPQRTHDPIRWSPLVVTFTFFCWIAFQIAVPIAVQLMASDERKSPISAVQFSCAVNVVILSLLLIILTENGQRRISEFGITLKNWREETRYGTLAFLASLLPVVAVLVVSWSLRSEETQHSFLKMLREKPGPEILFWIVLAAVVLAPLTEELVFRVILQGSLQSKFSPATAIAISSIVFAGVHGFPDSLALVPLAVVLGYVYHRRHSYLAVVVLHALFNLLNLILSQLSLQPDESASTGSLLW